VTNADTLPHLLSIDQVVERLGTSTRHIRRLIADRRIPYLKVGKLVRFDPDEINRWLDGSRVALRPPRPVAGVTRFRSVHRQGESDGAARRR
jgi:excisionase family DNA binding protein